MFLQSPPWPRIVPGGSACALWLALMGKSHVPSYLFSCGEEQISSAVGVTQLPGFTGAFVSDFSGTKALK